jgi:hypothetical protein
MTACTPAWHAWTQWMTSVKETCGELVNQIIPDSHVGCKVLGIKSGSHDCEVDMPIQILKQFGQSL